ncbi:hypothetical protein UO65_2683 [Actinokineospora spheciospongiae]|uniref:Uncharacterized protein n=1 Tax=Actinokineospora spheciospongiae TaxID=909613 RepID=W7IM94_9PSEU|nr:hypothetical protein UO65_2683 [Actinokineospora spheciospongiae]
MGRESQPDRGRTRCCEVPCRFHRHAPPLRDKTAVRVNRDGDRFAPLTINMCRLGCQTVRETRRKSHCEREHEKISCHRVTTWRRKHRPIMTSTARRPAVYRNSWSCPVWRLGTRCASIRVQRVTVVTGMRAWVPPLGIGGQSIADICVLSGSCITSYQWVSCPEVAGKFQPPTGVPGAHSVSVFQDSARVVGRW